MGNEIEVISELVENQMIFESKGYSVIKVTRAGVETPLRIPIKSTGITELQEKLSQRAPRPPVTKELVKKDSKEGRALGLPHDKIVMVFDTTDEKYIDATEKYMQDFQWRLVVFAIDTRLTMSDGKVAEEHEEKMRVLKSNGLTGHHIDKIVKDVRELTKWAEDREDFLSES